MLSTLPVKVPETNKEIKLKSRGVHAPLIKELAEIVEEYERTPELMHWYHFVPCAGVRYYTYFTSPSPVEPLVRRKG